MIPIPEYLQTALKNPKSNFSLLFPRLVDWDEGKEFKINKENISILEKYKSHLEYSREMLNIIHQNQQDYLNSFLGSKEVGKQIKATLVSPFITGLGAGHPTETGMILDRNTGVPYIPASTIKGVLRTAYAVSIADENGIADDKKLDEIFGGENNSSKIIFLDAYPEKIPTIQSDIMNVHYSDYYNKSVNKKDKKVREIPLENEEPVPIKFLSVKAGCNFVFRYIIKDNSITEIDVENWFQTAFEKIGFGGKTAIGYGRFKTEKVSVEKTAETKNVELNIDELVSKLKPEVVKKDKRKDVEAYISSAKGNDIKAKIYIIWEKNSNPQIFEISASGMNSAIVGQKVKLRLNNFSKSGPINGTITI